MARKLLLLFAALILATTINCQTSKGEEFTVKWDDSPISDWDLWSAERNFHVGDTLEFWYAAGWYDIYQVTRENYESCNYDNPVMTLSDSNLVGEQITRFDIKEYGDFYFLRRTYEIYPCEDQHKLHIYVPKPTPSPSSADLDFISNAPAPTPSSNDPSTSNAPAPTPSFNDLNMRNTPVPSPSSSSSGISSSNFLFGLVLAIILF